MSTMPTDWAAVAVPVVPVPLWPEPFWPKPNPFWPEPFGSPLPENGPFWVGVFSEVCEEGLLAWSTARATPPTVTAAATAAATAPYTIACGRLRRATGGGDQKPYGE